MTCRLLFACIYLLVQAESRGWADDRQKLSFALTTPGINGTSSPSSPLHVVSAEQRWQSLRKKLTDQLDSVEQLVAHVQMKRYTRKGSPDRIFTGTIDADIAVSEHSEKYSNVVVQNAGQSGVKTYNNLVKAPPPWSWRELTAPMLIARGELLHAEGAPVADLVDNEPALMLERKVPRSHRELFVYICGLRVYPDYTLRVWFDADSGNLRRALFRIETSATARFFFGIETAVWDVRFHEVTIDRVKATVPLRSSWETYFCGGKVEWTEQEFSSFRRLDRASNVHSELIRH